MKASGKIQRERQSLRRASSMRFREASKVTKTSMSVRKTSSELNRMKASSLVSHPLRYMGKPDFIPAEQEEQSSLILSAPHPVTDIFVAPVTSPGRAGAGGSVTGESSPCADGKSSNPMMEISNGHPLIEHRYCGSSIKVKGRLFRGMTGRYDAQSGAAIAHGCASPRG